MGLGHKAQRSHQIVPSTRLTKAEHSWALIRTCLGRAFAGLQLECLRSCLANLDGLAKGNVCIEESLPCSPLIAGEFASFGKVLFRLDEAAEKSDVVDLVQKVFGSSDTTLTILKGSRR